MAIFMLETFKLSKTLKSSRDDFNVLDNFNVSSIKTANQSNIFILAQKRLNAEGKKGSFEGFTNVCRKHHG